MIASLDASAKNLAQITSTIASGEGTAGLMVRDERLYESAVLALERFSESMATLQRILGKVEEDGYITVGKAPSGVWKKDFAIPGRDKATERLSDGGEYQYRERQRPANPDN